MNPERYGIRSWQTGVEVLDFINALAIVTDVSWNLEWTIGDIKKEAVRLE